MRYIQTYFECFKASGTDTTIQINRMRGQKTVEAIQFDHVTHDGISIVAELARKFPAEGFESPKLFVKPKPSLFKRLLELMKWYIRFYPFMPPKWKVFAKDQSENSNGMIEVENWNVGDQSVSTNTKLLYALDQTSQEYLTNPKAPRVWMTPVGIYSGIPRDLEPMNRVSFIDIRIRNNASLRDVQQESKQQLMDLSYWGTMLTMYLSIMLGKKIFTLFAKYTHLIFRRTGTFTNLGEWTIPGLAADEWWTFGQSCVAKMSPVTGTAIVVNGRLGLSVHFHPSVGFTPTEAQSFAEKWKANFIKCLERAI